jgi:lysophospholipase L1-like esterase
MTKCPRFSLALPVLLAAFAALASAAEAVPVLEPVAAELVRPRDGLGNVLAKLQAGGEVKLAYLGGSITAAAGWRVQTRAWFADQFPNAQVREINAAIGGTGSDLGVFRVQRDVLQHKPDLLFVEFAVNDGGASPERIWQAMEGIVRQTWAADPRTDICFVYTYRVGYEKELEQGQCPRAAAAMEMLADHYRIASINVALKVVQLQREGKLVFQSDVAAPAGVIRFSSDGVHPLDDGHRIYTDVVADAVRSMQSAPQAVEHGPKLDKPFVADHWQQAKMVPLTPEMLSGNWVQLDDQSPLARSFGARMGTLWETGEPGSKITFRFRGSQAKLYDLLGPDGGQVIVTVDGQTRDKPVPRFDSYCTYHRIATLAVAEGLDPAQTHTVTIEVHPEQPDRQSVAFRLKNPAEELKTAKFQGTRLRVSHLMLLGDLVVE